MTKPYYLSLATALSCLGISVRAQTSEQLDSVCIHKLPEAGPNPDLLAATNNGALVEMSDLANFSLMGDTEKEYSYAQALKVCHNKDKVNALQLTLKMHRYSYSNEDALVDQLKLNSYFAAVDERIAASPPRQMNMIGTVL